MEERNFMIILDALSNEISLLRYENERLRDENAALRKAMEATIKVAVEGLDDE